MTRIASRPSSCSAVLTSDQSAVSEDYSTSSSVTFDSVTVRQFERVAGDHPDVSDPHRGPPLSIGWKYAESSSMPINSFEKERQISRGSLQPINGVMRKNILQYGFQVTASEIQESMKEVFKTKKQREKTKNQGKNAERLDRIFHMVRRKYR
jgi:hypothetical protein